MKILIDKLETKDEIFGERDVDYSVNLSKVGEILEVEIPDFFTLETLPNGKKYLCDNGHATRIEEDENGNLVIFSGGKFYPVVVKP